MHGNNVVWLCSKYAVDANLFRLESSIKTRAKRATNRNNVGGNIPGWNDPGGIHRGEVYLELIDVCPGDDAYQNNAMRPTFWSIIIVH